MIDRDASADGVATGKGANSRYLPLMELRTTFEVMDIASVLAY